MLVADARTVWRRVAHVDDVVPVGTDVCVEEREQTAKVPQLFSDAGPQGSQSTAVVSDGGVALVEDPQGLAAEEKYPRAVAQHWLHGTARTRALIKELVEGEAKFPESGRLDADGALDAIDLETQKCGLVNAALHRVNGKPLRA